MQYSFISIDTISFTYQSITSKTFGFPSEVTSNPTAAGSTPESRKHRHQKRKQQRNNQIEPLTQQKSAINSSSLKNRPKIATTTPRPSYSGCSLTKRSAAISVFGMSDAKKVDSLSLKLLKAPLSSPEGIALARNLVVLVEIVSARFLSLDLVGFESAVTRRGRERNDKWEQCDWKLMTFGFIIWSGLCIIR